MNEMKSRTQDELLEDREASMQMNLYYNDSFVFEEKIWNQDGFVYDNNGNIIRRWYFFVDYLQRSDIPCIHKGEWCWMPNLFDIKQLQDKIRSHIKVIKQTSKVHNEWLESMLKAKIVPAIEPKSMSIDIIMNVCHIEPQTLHCDVNAGWKSPDKLDEHRQTQYSMHFTDICARDLPSGTKIDFKAGPAIKKIDEKIEKMWVDHGKKKSFLRFAVRRSVIVDINKRRSSKYTLIPNSVRPSHIAPHEVVVVNAGETKYRCYVYYHMHNLVVVDICSESDAITSEFTISV